MIVRNLIVRLTFASFCLTAPLALAQASTLAPSTKPLAFEVASIHPHEGPLRTIMGFSSSGPRVRLEGYNLRLLISEAYNLEYYQVSINEAIAHSDTYYDIAAAAPEDATPTRDDLRRMLQTLLADRLQLKAHFEKKQTPVYALTVAKGGSKLKPATGKPAGPCGVSSHGDGSVSAHNCWMDAIAHQLWNPSGRTVIDKTGLTGLYDFTLTYARDADIGSSTSAAAEPSSPTIFTALEEQLGLRLESAKGPVPVLVIDSISRPSEN